jgi:hypothetical protein
MSLLHVPVHAMCPFQCCVPMSMLDVHINAAGSSPSRTNMDMQHGHGDTAYTWARSIDVDMQHVLRHAAWT